jgi:hypothetical protein
MALCFLFGKDYCPSFSVEPSNKISLTVIVGNHIKWNNIKCLLKWLHVLLLDFFPMEITLNGIFVNIERPGWRVKESWFVIFFHINHVKFITQPTKCTSTNIVSSYAMGLIPMLIILVFKKRQLKKTKIHKLVYINVSQINLLCTISTISQ